MPSSRRQSIQSSTPSEPPSVVDVNEDDIKATAAVKPLSLNGQGSGSQPQGSQTTLRLQFIMGDLEQHLDETAKVLEEGWRALERAKKLREKREEIKWEQYGKEEEQESKK